MAFCVSIAYVRVEHAFTFSEAYEPMIASLRPDRLRILAVQTLRAPALLVLPLQYTPVYLPSEVRGGEGDGYVKNCV